MFVSPEKGELINLSRRMVFAALLGSSAYSLVSDQPKPQAPTYGQTIKDSLAFSSANTVLAVVINRWLPIGNTGFQEKLRQDMKEASESDKKFSRRAWALGCLGALGFWTGIPTLEEYVYRKVPDTLINDQSDSYRWDLGLITSTLFAAIHNIAVDGDSGKIKFIKESMPIPQFVAGLFLWKMQRERGYRHGVVSHIVYNTNSIPVAMITGFLMEKFLPSDRLKNKSVGSE